MSGASVKPVVVGDRLVLVVSFRPTAVGVAKLELRRGTALVGSRAARTRTGANGVRFAVPASLRAGSYTLVMRVTARGRTHTVRWPVRLG